MTTPAATPARTSLARTTMARTGLALLVALLTLTLAPGPSVASQTPEVEEDYGRMILVLDSSGSMAEKASGGTTKIQAARRALDTVIAGLPTEAHVGLRVFGSEVFNRSDKGACTDSRLVVEPGTDNRDALLAAVKDYEPYGETPISHALREAASDIGSEGRRSIVLVSDGEATCAPDPCVVAGELAEQGIDLVIDVVGLSVSGKAREQLACIAESGGGTYYDADDADDLERSLDRVAQRAMQPFTVAGERISGTPQLADAPRISAGSYVDRIPAEGDLLHYVVERTIPGSTLHAGFSAQPQAARQQLGLHFDTSDGESCGWGYGMNSVTEANALLVGSAMSHDTFSESGCASADELVLTLDKTTWSDEQVDAPLELVIIEEPPVGDAAMPDIQDEVVWEPMPLTGEVTETTFGTSFHAAPELADGISRASIVPGEVQLYRVPMEWGQRLQVEARFPALGAADGLMDAVAPVTLTIVSPSRGDTRPIRAERDGQPMSDAVTMVSTVDDRTARTTTLPIAYRNREGIAAYASASIAGDYFVMVQMNEDEGGDTFVLPFDLVVQRVGEPTGEPTYVDDGTAPATEDPSAGSSPSTEPSDEESETEPAAEADEGAGARPALAAAAGVGGLGLLAGGVLLWRRRRSGAATG